MTNYILTKSPLKNKKYRMTMPDEDHKHDFGARHRGDKGLGSKHSPAELSWSLLWSKPTLAKSIKFYENKFNVKVINRV